MAGSAIALTLSILPSLIQFAETMFSHKPNSGKEKTGAVVNMAQSALMTAAAAGAIPASQATDLVGIVGMVQSTVDDMKAQGKLGGNKPHNNVAKEPVPVQGPVVTEGIKQIVAQKQSWEK